MAARGRLPARRDVHAKRQRRQLPTLASTTYREPACGRSCPTSPAKRIDVTGDSLFLPAMTGGWASWRAGRKSEARCQPAVAFMSPSGHPQNLLLLATRTPPQHQNEPLTLPRPQSLAPRCPTWSLGLFRPRFPGQSRPLNSITACQIYFYTLSRHQSLGIITKRGPVL
jgi:hypothetical protein